MYKTPVEIPYISNLLSVLPELRTRIEDTYQFRCIVGLLSSVQERAFGITKQHYINEYRRLDAFIQSFELRTKKDLDEMREIPAKYIQCETMNSVRLHIAKVYIAVHMLVCIHDKSLIEDLLKIDYKIAFDKLCKLRERYLDDHSTEDPYLSLPAKVFEYELYPSPPSGIPPRRPDFIIEDIFEIHSNILLELRDEISSFPEFNETLKLKSLLETKKSATELGLPMLDLKQYSRTINQARFEYTTRARKLKTEILWQYFMNNFTAKETFAALVSNDFTLKVSSSPQPENRALVSPFAGSHQQTQPKVSGPPPTAYTRAEPVFSFVPMPLEQIKSQVFVILRLYLRIKYMKIYMILVDNSLNMNDDRVSTDEIIENLDLYSHFAHSTPMRYIPCLGDGVGSQLGLFNCFEDDLICLRRTRTQHVADLNENVPALEPDLSNFRPL